MPLGVEPPQARSEYGDEASGASGGGREEEEEFIARTLKEAQEALNAQLVVSTGVEAPTSAPALAPEPSTL